MLLNNALIMAHHGSGKEPNSEDGKYQLAVCYSTNSLYVSSDYGQTWTVRDSNRNWFSGSVSPTGQHMIAVNNQGYLYYSSNYGVTFTARTNAGTNSWYGCCLSGDAQHMYLAASGETYIQRSTDYGVSWSEVGSLGNHTSVACSVSGQYVTSVSYNTGMQMSTNYGVSWSGLDLVDTTFYGVAMSDSGQYQTAVTLSHGTYRSSNYGATWTQVSGGYSGWRVDMSSSGQHQLLSTNATYAYKSGDYGVTWTEDYAITQGYTRGVAVSATGKVRSILGAYRIAVSLDDGTNWTETKTGMSGGYQISVNRQNDSV